MEKSALRKEIREKKRQFTEEMLRKLSFPIIQKIIKHPKIKAASTLLLYHSLPDEVYTHELIELLHHEGKTILLPVVINNQQLEIRKYEGKESVQKGTMNIFEPIGIPYTNYSNIDVIIVPGMGFDHNGNRLGRGKGYYDRFLSSVSEVYKIGVCFDFQKVILVPTDENDIKMDEII